MTNIDFLEKWLSVFGEGVDKRIIEKYVTSEYNYLWHLFTWGNVPCIKDEEARAAFDKLEYTEAFKFYDGYSGQVENILVVERVSASDIDNDPGRDVYVVAKDFSWTYVRTHERGLCGPYLCVKNKSIMCK